MSQGGDRVTTASRHRLDQKRQGGNKHMTAVASTMSSVCPFPPMLQESTCKMYASHDIVQTKQQVVTHYTHKDQDTFLREKTVGSEFLKPSLCQAHSFDAIRYQYLTPVIPMHSLQTLRAAARLADLWVVIMVIQPSAACGQRSLKYPDFVIMGQSLKHKLHAINQSKEHTLQTNNKQNIYFLQTQMQK